MSALLLLWTACGLQGAQSTVANPTTRSSYCGVQSLCRAMAALDKPIPFPALLRPQYIGSPKGSSAEELLRAATDFGLQAELMSGMTWSMLESVDCPVILHVKGDLASASFNHWVLFVGLDRGKAKIYDGTNAAQPLEPVDLLAKWDGRGVLISDRPLHTLRLRLLASLPLLVQAAAIAFFIAFIGFLHRHLVTAQGMLGVLADAAVLLVLSLGVQTIYRVCSDAGFLSSRAAIDAIQNSHYADFRPTMKAAHLRQLIGNARVTIVDARQRPDYEAGHVPGAVNIPPNSPIGAISKAMAGIATDSRVIIYCQSIGCPYSASVGKDLEMLGYRDITLFPGGWVEWQGQTGASQR